MKTMYRNERGRDNKYHADTLRRQEENAGGFRCSHCRTWVPINETMGTSNRNHCPSCLWSKHLDAKTPGDRASECGHGMEPIGLTFKAEGQNRQDGERQGELMLIHECQGCNKISINRIAADDYANILLDIFEASLELSIPQKIKLAMQTIRLLSTEDLPEIKKQLFGSI